MAKENYSLLLPVAFDILKYESMVEGGRTLLHTADQVEEYEQVLKHNSERFLLSEEISGRKGGRKPIEY